MISIETFRVRSAGDLPQSVLVPFDSVNDHFLAGFDNYPATGYLVLVSWSDDLLAAALVLTGGLITACVEMGDDEIPEAPMRHIAKLVDEAKRTHDFLIVHDADDTFWPELSFVAVPPPASSQNPGLVYAWNTKAEDVYRTFQARKLEWPRSRRLEYGDG
jgi:hypothetical protein